MLVLFWVIFVIYHEHKLYMNRSYPNLNRERGLSWMCDMKFNSIVDSRFGFCDVVFGWDAADICYDNVTVTGWHSGYPDAEAKIDLDTFRKIPWEADVPFFLADFENKDGEALVSCPRNLLKNPPEE